MVMQDQDNNTFWFPSDKERIRLANLLNLCLRVREIDEFAASRETGMSVPNILALWEAEEYHGYLPSEIEKLAKILYWVHEWHGDDPQIVMERTFAGNLEALFKSLSGREL
ncbi:MAG: hypothetical protein NVS2B14_11000 [Chamaesiphon sp.]